MNIMIKMALNNIFKKFSLTFATIISLTITLFIIGFMSISYFNIINISKKIDQGFKVVANVDSKYDKKNKRDEKIYKDIEKQFSSIKEIKYSKFSSKSRELSLILRQDDSKQMEKDLEGDNPLSDTYYLSVHNEKQLKVVRKKVAKIKNIESSSYGGNEIISIIKKIHSWEKIFIIIIILLFILSVILIMNVIRVAIINRKEEIEIMRLVGASNRLIRWPYIIESIFLSLFSSIISITLLFSSYNYFYKSLTNIFIGNINILSINQLIFPVIFVVIIFSMVISLLASIITIRRFIKI